MKKIFTLALVLLAMVAVNAQYLLNEDFETSLPSTWTTIDADGDGVNWIHSSTLGTIPGHNASAGCAISQSYDNSTGALTPNNYLITPAIALTSNATLTYYVCGQDASYAAEHYAVLISTTGNTAADFTTTLLEETISATRTQGAWLERTINLSAYTGQTVYIAFRHYNVTDQFYLNLDDVSIFVQPTTPTIVSHSNNIDFGAIAYPGNANASVVIDGYSLTNAISVTTAAPFSVSADNATFATTASLPAAGGTLYVRYTPTAAGTDNDMVVLAADGVYDTIMVAGSAFDCSNTTIPYTCSFDSQLIDCWQIVDANNDGSTFVINQSSGYAQYAYNSSNAANDWLISPIFNFTGSEYASFEYYAASTSYPERFQVYALGSDTVALTAAVDVTSTAAQTQILDLSNLSGAYKIGIKCISDADEFYLYIDNFNVNLISGSSVSVSADSLDFSMVAMNATSNAQAFLISSINLNEPITISVPAPFQVSVDGTTYATSATIPANSSFSVNDTVFVRFAPTAVGTYSEYLTVTTTSTTDTIVVLGQAVDCSDGIASLPYTYDFNTGLYPPICWTVNDESNFSAVTIDEDNGDKGLAFLATDRIVTPEINATDAMLLTFDYASYGGNAAVTTFHVGYSSTTADAASFTWGADVTADASSFAPYTAVIPAGTKYVAIEVTEMGEFTYIFWSLPNYLFVDNFSLTAVSEPTMLLSAESLDFGTISLGNNAVQTVNVMGALLTSDITVTAPASYEVSADGQTYGSSATLAANGGNLYVKFAPTTEGSHTGNVTLTSGTATKTVAVSGSGVDCSAPATLPFVEGFESELSGCWSNLDRDGDGYFWTIYTEDLSDYAHTGNGFVTSQSYINNVGSLSPDNWLITPTIAIPAEGANLSWWVSALDANYADDYYEVLVAPAGSDNFTAIFNGTAESDTWAQKSVLLMDYANQNIRIAFNHKNSEDIYWLMIDDLEIVAGVGVEDHQTVVNVYPNPANNMININASDVIDNLVMVNMAGQVVYTETISANNAQVNVSSLASGIYFVKVNTANGESFTKKITVAR